MELKFERAGFIITTRCTLKCRLCGEYCPYIKNPVDMSVDKFNRAIDNYFKIVDFVGDFCLSGGEPLMHRELAAILEKSYEYKDRINRIFIITNATLLFSEKSLDIMKKDPKKFFVNISHYGEHSKKADELSHQIEEIGVPYRVLNYADGDLYHDGWVDYRDHTKKHNDIEEIMKQAKDCTFIGKGYGYSVQDGKLFRCARGWRRMEIGIIPDNPKEYVDLISDDFEPSEKRKGLEEMATLTYLSSCAYCNGLRDDGVRYKPAEQLTKEEMDEIRAGKCEY
jgi:organic radical activating enzyme